jgi:hypothetical protein
MGVGGQRHTPAALPLWKNRYTLYGGWVGSRAGQYGCGKSRPPPGFDPRTTQPVASRYTDWAILANPVYDTNINWLVFTQTMIWQMDPHFVRENDLNCCNYRNQRHVCICVNIFLRYLFTSFSQQRTNKKVETSQYVARLLTCCFLGNDVLSDRYLNCCNVQRMEGRGNKRDFCCHPDEQTSLWI